MQAAERSDQFVAGPKEKVIRIGENDLRVEFVEQMPLRDALDSRLSSHRHEHRRLDDTVFGVNHPRSRARVRADGLKLEVHSLNV